MVACPDPRFSAEEKKEFLAIADMVVDDLSQFDKTLFDIASV